MKKFKYILYIPVMLLALAITSCEDTAKNPVFGDDELPRIFGWPLGNSFAVDIEDSLVLDFTISPANDATYQWFLDDVEISTDKRLEIEFDEVKEYNLKFVVTRNNVVNSRQAIVNVTEDRPFEPKPFQKKMIGFLTRDGSLNDVNFAHLTHLVISSAIVGEVEGKLVDTTFTGMDIPQIVSAAHSAGVYVMLDVTGNMVNLTGGGLYADYAFFNVIADPAKRTTAINTIMKFATDNKLDGINIFLNNTSEGSLDQAVVKSFFEAIPDALPDGPNGVFFYSATVPGGWTTQTLAPVSKIDAIDWINIQAFRYEDLAPVSHSPQWAAADLAAQWMGLGVPKEKIVIGFPAFGLHYFLPDDGTVVGWGNLWQFTAYKSFKSLLATDPDAHTKNLIAVDDGIFYDGHPAVIEKATYVVDQEFGGLMMWSVESDTKDPVKSLLKAAYTGLGN